MVVGQVVPVVLATGHFAREAAEAVASATKVHAGMGHLAAKMAGRCHLSRVCLCWRCLSGIGLLLCVLVNIMFSY